MALGGARQSSLLPGSSQTTAALSICVRVASSLKAVVQMKVEWVGAHVVRCVSGCCRSVFATWMFRRSDDKTDRAHRACRRRKKAPTCASLELTARRFEHSIQEQERASVTLRHTSCRRQTFSWTFFSPHFLPLMLRCGHDESNGRNVSSK